MRFRFLTQNNSILSCMAKRTSCEEAAFLENWTTFVWHVYSSSWSDQPSFRQLSLKDMFSILSNNNCVPLIKYLTHINGMFHKFNKTFFKNDYTLSRGCYMHTVYHMFKQCLIVFENMVRRLGRISHYAFRKMLCNCEGHILCAYIYTVPCVLHVRKHIVKRDEKGIACARGFIFDIEVDEDMTCFNGDVPPF